MSVGVTVDYAAPGTIPDAALSNDPTDGPAGEAGVNWARCTWGEPGAFESGLALTFDAWDATG